MALTFNEMAQQILSETYRDQSFLPNVYNAIVSAIKEIEIQELFVNQTLAILNLTSGAEYVDLPDDFISVLIAKLVYNPPVTVPLASQPPIFYTEANGFKETTFWDLQTYNYNDLAISPGIPCKWAIFKNRLYTYPIPVSSTDGGFFQIDLYYYYRDPYPVNPTDTSIWMGDYTQDCTRYKAKEIFYRDTLQSEEFAAINQAKYMEALSVLKLRNSQRENINTLSF